LTLLIAVIIAALVAFHLSRKPTTEQMQREQSRILPHFAADSIVFLTVEADGKRITCRRNQRDKDKKWYITEPLRLRADSSEIEDIIRRLEGAVRVGVVYPEEDKPLDLAQYGLDRPRCRVTLAESAPGGRIWTLLVGKETGVGDTVFLKHQGEDAVLCVAGDIARRVSINLNSVRSKKLAERIETSELTSVAISAPEWEDRAALDIRCVRTDGVWELGKPLRDLANGSEVEGLAEEINNHFLAEDDFVVDDPTRAGQYGLENPSLSLTFQTADRATTIVFGKRKQDEARIYAMNKAEQAIVTVPMSLFEKLRKEPHALRERSLAVFEKADVAKITAVSAHDCLVVEKVQDGWRICGDEPAKADNIVIGDILSGLQETTVEQFVDDAPEKLDAYGLSENERREIVLADARGTTLCVLHLGTEDERGEAVYARRPPYAPVLSVRKESYLADLLQGRLALLDRLILDESQSRALKVSLRWNGQCFLCERDSTSKQWKLAEPVRGRADDSALKRILMGFCPLRAAGFIAETAEDLSAFGLDRPAGVVSVTYQGKEGKDGRDSRQEPPTMYTRTLLIGRKSVEMPESVFTMLAGDSRVFLLPEHKVADFRANPASKLICTAQELRKLVFRKDDKDWTFTYDEVGARWLDPAGEELTEDVRDALEEAARLLRHFKGERIESYTEKSPMLYGFDSPLLVVELVEKGTSGKFVIVGKKAGEGGRFVKGPASSFVLVASDADIEKLVAVTKAPKE